MVIKPKFDQYYTGAKSGKRMRMLAGVPHEVDAEEIAHIDKADYSVVSGDAVKAEEPRPEPVAKGKKK